jgi:hypothetical protein
MAVVLQIQRAVSFPVWRDMVCDATLFGGRARAALVGAAVRRRRGAHNASKRSAGSPQSHGWPELEHSMHDSAASSAFRQVNIPKSTQFATGQRLLFAAIACDLDAQKVRPIAGRRGCHVCTARRRTVSSHSAAHIYQHVFSPVRPLNSQQTACLVLHSRRDAPVASAFKHSV